MATKGTINWYKTTIELGKAKSSDGKEISATITQNGVIHDVHIPLGLADNWSAARKSKNAKETETAGDNIICHLRMNGFLERGFLPTPRVEKLITLRKQEAQDKKKLEEKAKIEKEEEEARKQAEKEKELKALAGRSYSWERIPSISAGSLSSNSQSLPDETTANAGSTASNANTAVSSAKPSLQNRESPRSPSSLVPGFYQPIKHPGRDLSFLKSATEAKQKTELQPKTELKDDKARNNSANKNNNSASGSSSQSRKRPRSPLLNPENVDSAKRQKTGLSPSRPALKVKEPPQGNLTEQDKDVILETPPDEWSSTNNLPPKSSNQNRM